MILIYIYTVYICICWVRTSFSTWCCSWIPGEETRIHDTCWNVNLPWSTARMIPSSSWSSLGAWRFAKWKIRAMLSCWAAGKVDMLTKNWREWRNKTTWKGCAVPNVPRHNGHRVFSYVADGVCSELGDVFVIVCHFLLSFSWFKRNHARHHGLDIALDIWKMKIQQMKQCSRSQDACYQAIPPVLLKQGMTAGCGKMCLHIHSEGCIPKANLIKSDSLEFLDGPKASLRLCHHFQLFSLNMFSCKVKATKPSTVSCFPLILTESESVAQKPCQARSRIHIPTSMPIAASWCIFITFVTGTRQVTWGPKRRRAGWADATVMSGI